jgi:release factor glutamine methyltransferase
VSEASTVRDVVTATAAALTAAGVASARLEARLLVGHVLGAETEAVLCQPERYLDDNQRHRLAALVERRTGHEPLAYIFGEREFWSLPFRVTVDTLVPRPESETLIETALHHLCKRPAALRILDLGTGSGCLLLALLSELPLTFGVGVDRSPAAVSVARTNARALRLDRRAVFLAGAWADAIAGRFDVVVCNPPYVADGEIASLAPEVAGFEPRLALSGGTDGLDAYRQIAPQIHRLLAPGGLAFFEMGYGQATKVAGLFRSHYLQLVDIKNDLCGIPRCLVVAAETPRTGKIMLGNQAVPV